jgi:hypothetical protein
VLIVAQQDVIDRAEIIDSYHGIGEFLQGNRASGVFGLAPVKGRVCQESQSAKLDECSWAAYVPDLYSFLLSHAD